MKSNQLQVNCHCVVVLFLAVASPVTRLTLSNVMLPSSSETHTVCINAQHEKFPCNLIFILFAAIITCTLYSR